MSEHKLYCILCRRRGLGRVVPVPQGSLPSYLPPHRKPPTSMRWCYLPYRVVRVGKRPLPVSSCPRETRRYGFTLIARYVHIKRTRLSRFNDPCSRNWQFS